MFLTLAQRYGLLWSGSQVAIPRIVIDLHSYIVSFIGYDSLVFITGARKSAGVQSCLHLSNCKVTVGTLPFEIYKGWDTTLCRGQAWSQYQE